MQENRNGLATVADGVHVELQGNGIHRRQVQIQRRRRQGQQGAGFGAAVQVDQHLDRVAGEEGIIGPGAVHVVEHRQCIAAGSAGQGGIFRDPDPGVLVPRIHHEIVGTVQIHARHGLGILNGWPIGGIHHGDGAVGNQHLPRCGILPQRRQVEDRRPGGVVHRGFHAIGFCPIAAAAGIRPGRADIGRVTGIHWPVGIGPGGPVGRVRIGVLQFAHQLGGGRDGIQENFLAAPGVDFRIKFGDDRLDAIRIHVGQTRGHGENGAAFAAILAVEQDLADRGQLLFPVHGFRVPAVDVADREITGVGIGIDQNGGHCGMLGDVGAVGIHQRHAQEIAVGGPVVGVQADQRAVGQQGRERVGVSKQRQEIPRHGVGVGVHAGGHVVGQVVAAGIGPRPALGALEPRGPVRVIGVGQWMEAQNAAIVVLGRDGHRQRGFRQPVGVQVRQIGRQLEQHARFARRAVQHELGGRGGAEVVRLVCAIHVRHFGDAVGMPLRDGPRYGRPNPDHGHQAQPSFCVHVLHSSLACS